MLRFREATVEVQVYPGKGTDADESVAGHEADGWPTIVDWHPRYAEGPAKTMFEKFNISIEGDAIPLAGGMSFGPNIGYSLSREREARRRIHGTLEGDAARVVEWRLEENSSTGDGIPPTCDVALLVRWPSAASFHLRMRVRAITLAGIPVIGRNVRALYFTPDTASASHGGLIVRSPEITGGVVGAGQELYASPGQSVEDDARDNDPSSVPLESLIRIAEQLAQD